MLVVVEAVAWFPVVLLAQAVMVVVVTVAVAEMAVLVPPTAVAEEVPVEIALV